MHLKLVEKRFERDWRRCSEKVCFASRFLAKFAEIVLGVVRKKKGTAAMAGSRGIDVPKVDVRFFRDGNSCVNVRVNRSETGTEVIYARRDQDERTPIACCGPAFH